MHDSVHPPYFDISTDYPDTSFAVTIIDTGSVSMFGQIFQFKQADSANGVIYFGTASYFYTYQSGTGVAYFYNKDSIAYVSGDISGIHSMVMKTVYHTY